MYEACSSSNMIGPIVENLGLILDVLNNDTMVVPRTPRTTAPAPAPARMTAAWPASCRRPARGPCGRQSSASCWTTASTRARPSRTILPPGCSSQTTCTVDIRSVTGRVATYIMGGYSQQGGKRSISIDCDPPVEWIDGGPCNGLSPIMGTRHPRPTTSAINRSEPQLS